MTTKRALFILLTSAQNDKLTRLLVNLAQEIHDSFCHFFFHSIRKSHFQFSYALCTVLAALLSLTMSEMQSARNPARAPKRCFSNEFDPGASGNLRGEHRRSLGIRKRVLSSFFPLYLLLLCPPLPRLFSILLSEKSRYAGIHPLFRYRRRCRRGCKSWMHVGVGSSGTHSRRRDSRLLPSRLPRRRRKTGKTNQCVHRPGYICVSLRRDREETFVDIARRPTVLPSAAVLACATACGYLAERAWLFSPALEPRFVKNILSARVSTLAVC